MRSIHTFLRIPIEAFFRFNADDGWAIASHIALSLLMAMFPFLILVTAIAGFIGSGISPTSRPPDRGGVAA